LETGLLLPAAGSHRRRGVGRMRRIGISIRHRHVDADIVDISLRSPIPLYRSFATGAGVGGPRLAPIFLNAMCRLPNTRKESIHVDTRSLCASTPDNRLERWPVLSDSLSLGVRRWARQAAESLRKGQALAVECQRTHQLVLGPRSGEPAAAPGRSDSNFRLGD